MSVIPLLCWVGRLPFSVSICWTFIIIVFQQSPGEYIGHNSKYYFWNMHRNYDIESLVDNCPCIKDQCQQTWHWSKHTNRPMHRSAPILLVSVTWGQVSLVNSFQISDINWAEKSTLHGYFWTAHTTLSTYIIKQLWMPEALSS